MNATPLTVAVMLDLEMENQELRKRITELEAKTQRPTYPLDMLGRPVTSRESEFDMDMKAAPFGGKLILLNPGKVAVFGSVNSDNRKHFLGWSPLPKIPASAKE